MSRADVAQRLEFRQALARAGARVADEAGAGICQRPLQLGVGERRVRVLLERRGDGRVPALHRAASASAPRRSARRPSVMPASTSATWRTSIGAPSALQLAGHVHQAAEIAGEQRVGAGRARCPVFSSTMALEMSGYFTQNVPPKPQQTSASSQLVERQALRPCASSRRGWLLDAELAQARAGIVIGDACRRSARRPRSTPRTSARKRDQLVGLGGERLGARAP